MTVFFSADIQVPISSIAMMIVSMLLSVGLPAGLIIFGMLRYKLKAIPALVGVAAFIVFALVLEQGLHLLVLRPDADGSIALRKTPLLFTVYACLAAGVFEETARYICLRLLGKKYSGVKTGLSYGIGHGGIESILLTGLAMLNNIVLAIIINLGTASVSGIPGELSQLIIDTPAYMYVVSGFERVCAITIHIALSVVVYYAVARSGKWWLFPGAILLHALANVPAALYQCGVIGSVFVVEACTAAAAVIVAGLAFAIHRWLRGGDALSGEAATV